MHDYLLTDGLRCRKLILKRFIQRDWYSELQAECHGIEDHRVLMKVIPSIPVQNGNSMGGLESNSGKP